MPAAEMDRGQRFAAIRMAQGQLEMALADGTPLQHLEATVEQRLGEALPPGTAVAQGLGVEAVELLRAQFSVAVQFRLQQYSTMVGLHSAAIKLIKDTLMGIIAKIA